MTRSTICISTILIYFFQYCSAQQNTRTEVERLINILASDSMQGRQANTEGGNRAAGFIASEFEALGLTYYKGLDSYFQTFQNGKYKNVVGVLEGKSLKKEYLVFSAHYDHLGIINRVKGDSIANGADDDASGVTAVLCLAKHFVEKNNNERTLVFIAFTAEEIGLVGSKHFAKDINPEEFVAGINIEMIGKVSKNGKNSAFITGFRRSNLGQILQKNTEGLDFMFTPDPYPFYNLFYRSDNASFARKGIPAHTISSVPIDKDKYYHTVEDEVKTLDLDNMTATIKALMQATEKLATGQDTPSRVK